MCVYILREVGERKVYSEQNRTEQKSWEYEYGIWNMEGGFVGVWMIRYV